MAEKSEFAMVIDVLKRLLNKYTPSSSPTSEVAGADLNAPAGVSEGGLSPEVAPKTASTPSEAGVEEENIDTLRQKAFRDALSRMGGGSQDQNQEINK